MTAAHLLLFGFTPLAGFTTLNPGDDWQAAVTANPAGQTFLITAGTHRLQNVSPKTNQSFLGASAATTIMSGAKLLSGFVSSGGFWKVTGQTQAQGTRSGQCQLSAADAPGSLFATSYGGCDYAEELFFDSVRKVHVQTQAELAPGKWWFDYAGDEIWVGDDPTGHTVETSTTPWAFQPTANGVTLRNLTVQMYANIAQYGPINAENTYGWTITDCRLQLNHGGGVRIGHAMQLLRNLITKNGQEGVVGIGDDVLVENNEISYNNGAHFNPGWEAGGTKFVLTNRLQVRGNWVHHNEGPGIWGDIDNYQAVIENNCCEDNDQMGIFWEISWACVIRNNTVRRNGFGYWVPPNYIWGTGILVAASPDVEIYGNTVEDNNGGIAAVQQNRGSGTFGPHEIANLYVHDNQTKQATGWTGLAQGVGDQTYFFARNNRYVRNTYYFGGGQNHFTWADLGDIAPAAWYGYGNDVTGTPDVQLITPDAAVYGGFVSDVSQTTSFTMGVGADGYLLVGVLGDAVSDFITGVTFNGVALTLLGKQNSSPGAVFWQYLYGLANPTPGTHNIVVSASSTTNYIQTFASSYLGVKEPGEPEAQSALTAGGTSPYVTTLTTINDLDWTVLFVNSSVGLIVQSPLTLRASDTSPTFTAGLGDSNGGITPPGSTTLAAAGGGGQKQSLMVALAPSRRPIGGATYNDFAANVSSLALDSAVYGGFVSATSQTTSFTMSASVGGYLVVGVLGDASSDFITGVTFNGVALTLVGKQNSSPGSVFWQYLYVLANPTAGTHNIVVSASATTNYIQTYAASYIGVKTAGQPEATSLLTSGAGNPYLTALTTLTDLAWTVEFVNSSVGLIVNSPFTIRAYDASPTFTSALGDSNGGITPAGPTTLSVAGVGGQKQSLMIALAPIVGVVKGRQQQYGQAVPRASSW